MISDKLMQDIVNLIESSIVNIAVGTGSEPANNETTLENEVLRKAGTTYVDDNTIVTELYIDETECNDLHLTNVGVFASQLYAGGTIDEQKSSDESLTVSVEITVARE